MGIPLLRGRGIADRDGSDAPAVVVINRAMAERYWPDGDPIGKPLLLRGAIFDGERRVTVVGVVGDIKHGALDDPTEPQIYAPQAQVPFIFATLVVRTELEPMALADQVRAAVWSVDPEQPVWKMRTMESLLARSLRSRSLTALLLGIYSAVALLLAALGIYGVIAYMVSQRTHEIGVRMALGAPARLIVSGVVRHGLVLAGWGLGLGCAGTALLVRLVRSQLFGVSAADPLTFGGVLVLLALVALLASWIPARRATRIDPASALRAD
jgi:putative ABC transport system permease protein